MKILIFTVCIILIVILIVEVITEYFFSQVIVRKVKNHDDLLEDQIKRGLIDIGYYKGLKKEKVYMTTNDGLKLEGIYIKGEPEINKTIIVVHGITVGIPTSIKYMRMFLDRGWNVLMYNQRRHGASEGKYSTYGYYEKYDLDLWVNWVVNRNGEDSIIGLHGESMGAATVLQYADINKYVDFIIADCAYSDMNELMKFRIKEDIKLPSFPILKFVELKSKIRAKFSFKDVSPINSIRYNEIPVLFIHGKNDKFVPTYMSEKMYEVKKGMKRIYLADGAVHACSIEVNKQKYEKVVFEFVNEVEANLGKFA